MDPFTILGISLGLAMDAFAVSLATSAVLRSVTGRHYFRFAFHFGLFQFLMPIMGWLLGSSVAGRLADYDHWIAFALLGFIGGKMIVEALRDHEPGFRAADPTRGWSLVALSVATSIDALAVGIGFALLAINIWLVSLVIGVVAAAMSALGMRFGGRLGVRFGSRMELAGGLILIAVGVHILVEHLA